MLEAGAAIGPYEVMSLLGAGGMGEVYRARDPRLGREVALKVLPASVASDPDRLRRFELEAKAVGALNHPNVLAVFDVGAHDGQPYVVAELLEGETLRGRLGGVPLPLRKALDYAGQIARGLAAAHEKGIVHRDLKPENLFVTKDGRVKILDFGLAKLVRPEDPSSHTATLSQDEPGTSPGAILGTVGYMSPEQVRGAPADQRADIFAFGAILYEMLSGQRAFRGETTADTLHAILREEPKELSGINPGISPGLERVVRHCLEKSPGERFQSARDLAFNLEALSETSGVRPGAPARAGSRALGPWIWRAGLALAVGIGLFVAARATKETPPPPTYRRMTFRQGIVVAARIAADDETIVYSAAWQGRPLEVFLGRVGSRESRSLGLPEARLLSLSSSGELALLLRPRLVAWMTHEGTLARVSLTGGTPREVLDDVQDADWSPDGKQLAVIRRLDAKWLLEFPLGHVLYAPPPPVWISELRVSPRGDRVAFIEHPVDRDLRGSVAVVDLAGKRQTLADGFSAVDSAMWSSHGDEVWFNGSRTGDNPVVGAVSLSGRERAVASGGHSLVDVSRTGRALTTLATVSSAMLALLPGATRERDLSELDESLPVDLSADGRTLVGVDVGEGGGPHESIFLRPTDGSPAVWLGEGSALALSPDGKRVLANYIHTSPQKLVLVPTGAGPVQELPPGGLDRYLEGKWFPDGHRVLLAGAEPGHESRLYVQDVEGGAPRAISPEGYELPSLGRTVSADGSRTIAFDKDLTAVMYPLDGGDPTPIRGLEPGDVPIGWTADGRGLFFYKVDAPAATVFQVELGTGRTQTARELLPMRPAGMHADYRILATPDGRCFVYSYTRSLSDLYVVEGLR